MKFNIIQRVIGIVTEIKSKTIFFFFSFSHRSSPTREFTAKYIIDDPSLLQKTVNYENQPDSYLYPLDNKYSPRPNKKLTIKDHLQSSDDDADNAMASEMSGYDSESIDETIRVFTSKLQCKLYSRSFKSVCLLFSTRTITQ